MLKKLKNIHGTKKPNTSTRKASYNEPLKSERYCDKKSLPKDFAENLLDLEIEMDKENININALRKLLELYAVLNI